MQGESAGRRREDQPRGQRGAAPSPDDLGIGLWLCEPAANAYAAELKSRGKHGGVIGCALAHRANRIAYALVRDHASYDPSRWSQHWLGFHRSRPLAPETQELSTRSARRAARTNDVDQRRAPAHPWPGRRNPLRPNRRQTPPLGFGFPPSQLRLVVPPPPAGYPPQHPPAARQPTITWSGRFW